MSHPSDSHLLLLFLKSSRLFKFFISIGTICQTFEAKNFIEFSPYLLLFTEILRKSDWVRKLYFIALGGKMLVIISFERFCFILYISIPRLSMFLWWMVKEWSFWSNSWNKLMLSSYTILSERSCKWLIFLFNTLPLNIQSSGQWRNWASMKDFISILLCVRVI